MAPVFTILLPVFLMILIGGCLGRFAGFAEHHYKGIAALTFNLLVPALLFNGSLHTQWPSSIPWGLFASYYLPQFIIFTIAWFACGYRLSHPQRACVALGSTYSNNVLIGIPAVLAVFGEPGMAPAFMIIAFHSALLFTISGIALELGRSNTAHWRLFFRALRKTLTTPLVASLLLGFVANGMGLMLPTPIQQLLSWLGDAAIPCSLLVLGIAISKYSLTGLGPRVLIMSLLKVGLMPVLVWWSVTFLWQLDFLDGAVAVLLAATPVGVNAYAFAHQHQQSEAEVAAAVLLSTIVASISMSAWLAWMLLPNT
ncbi:AEC family transporter [Corallincola spongiicola]|uniref:AEC family transporter n=1 Tax=Corallincola spongiicola TaxID=2520508 RepID=A0ABY1WRN3_9GAMM|nr:AEC family transporter [Corallincola spongiicola]TAA47285.1 AEC family transporter [Corallincola spongiicola]